MAIGSDVQWKRLTATADVRAGRATPARATNEGRQQGARGDPPRHGGRRRGCTPPAEIAATISGGDDSRAAIHDIRQVRELPALAGTFTTTRTPQGQTVPDAAAGREPARHAP